MFGIGGPEFALLSIFFLILTIPLYALSKSKKYKNMVGDEDELSIQKIMSEEERTLFQSEMAKVRKNRTTGLLLALFLGSFGAHYYYTGNIKMGVLYSVFSWTGIPTLLAILDCFYIMSFIDFINYRNMKVISSRVMENKIISCGRKLEESSPARLGKKNDSKTDQNVNLNPLNAQNFFKGMKNLASTSKFSHNLKKIKNNIDLSNSELFIERGKQKLKANLYYEAIAELSKSIEINETNGESYYIRAIAYSKVKEPKKAFRDIEKAAKLDHESAIRHLSSKEKQI
jgi:TM2 domain-containing membrane protein YozV